MKHPLTDAQYCQRLVAMPGATLKTDSRAEAQDQCHEAQATGKVLSVKTEYAA